MVSKVLGLVIKYHGVSTTFAHNLYIKENHLLSTIYQKLTRNLFARIGQIGGQRTGKVHCLSIILCDVS
jgi:hypothetical protein